MDPRSIPAVLRAAVDAEGAPIEGVLTGYGAVYETPYKIPGTRRRESLSSSAFVDNIAERNGAVPIFWGHGWAKEANATPIGVAHVRSDEQALHIERAELFVDISAEAQAVWRAYAAGALREWSVGFKPAENGISVRGDLDYITRGELLELSMVVKGAGYTDTTSVREDVIDAGAAGNEPDEKISSVTTEQVLNLLAHPGVADAFTVINQEN